jgi:methionyl-tRNA formyltransferase
LGGRLIVDAMRALESGKLAATPQPEMGVTYAAKISKQEAALNFQASATILERKIRAFNPFPAASAEIAGITLKIWHAECVDLTGEPGQILSVTEQGVTVACSHGALVLKELQKPGGKRLPAAEFVKGFPMKSGQRFEIHS